MISRRTATLAGIVTLVAVAVAAPFVLRGPAPGAGTPAASALPLSALLAPNSGNTLAATLGAELPRVAILATGGTIAGVGYAEVKDRNAEALEGSVPGLSEIAQIQTEDPFSLPSSMIFPEHVLALATRVRQLLASDPGLAGIVITQGTDSLEEVSFLVDLLVDDPRPVVFTGAMRLPGELGDDGARNLLGAVRLASSPAARGLGVLVTMNDEVHAAREIRKTDSTGVEAFSSPSGGPIARFDAADLFLMRRPARRLSLDATVLEPRVDLLRVAIGSDGHLIKAAVEAGAQGLVLELFGRANTGAMWDELWNARQKGVVVVATSRIGHGPLWVRKEWQQKGLIYAEDLDGLKARLVLMAALPITRDPVALQDVFDRLAGRVPGR